MFLFHPPCKHQDTSAKKKKVKTFNITAILSKPLTHYQATLSFPILIRDEEKKLT